MNKIFITGRIGKDLELKTAGNGTEYLLFPVAVDRRKQKDKDQETDWFNCTAFGKMAAFVNSYFHKGDGIEIIGHMQNDPYKPKDSDKKVSSWSLIVESIEFPKGSRKEAAPASNQEQTVVSLDPAELDDIPF